MSGRKASGLVGGSKPPGDAATWIARPDLGFYAVATPIGASSVGALFALDATSKAIEQQERVPARLEPAHCARLRSAISSTEAAWARRVQADVALRGTGATLVSILFDVDRVAVGHLGDCRVYQTREGRFIRQTLDHRLAAQHRRVIVRGIGLGSNPELVSWDVEPGDCFLLSGGVHDLVADEELLALLLASPPRLAAEQMLSLATARGATDCQTVLIVGPE
jgi:serine/threonine protein phosphatase PrpC